MHRQRSQFGRKVDREFMNENEKKHIVQIFELLIENEQTECEGVNEAWETFPHISPGEIETLFERWNYLPAHEV